MRGATNQRSTPHNGGGGTHQHSTPHHGGGHTPTQHAPSRGGPRSSTEPTPARRSTQPQLQSNRRPQPPKHADHKVTKTTPNKQNKPRMAPAKSPARAQPTRTQRRQPPGGTHDENPSQTPPHHAKPPRRTGSNKVRASNTNATATQPPTKATLTRRPKGGEDEAEPTEHAAHGAGQNTTSPDQTLPAGRWPRPPRLDDGTPTQCAWHTLITAQRNTPDRPPSTRPKQKRLNATGCARAGLPTVHLTQHTASTRRQTTAGNVAQRVVQRPTRAQRTNTETGMTTTRTTSDRASNRCSAKEPTPNKPTMRWPRQPCTNKTAAAATT